MSRKALWFAASALLVLIAASCSDDEEDDAPAPPPGPASLRIVSLIGAGNQARPREQGGALSLDCTARLGVTLELENWRLRPPDACGATQQCGYIAVSLDPTDSGQALLVEAASATIVLDLSALGADAAGTHRLHAELKLDDKSTFIGDAGTPVADDVDLELTLLPCPDSGVGGADGSGGAGGGGSDAGGQAGQGGAANGGAAGNVNAGGVAGAGGAFAGAGGA